MRNGNDHLVVSIEVFGIELVGSETNFGAAFVAEALLALQQFVLHHLVAKCLVAENLLVVGYLAFQFLILGMQFLLLYVGQLTQTHVYDGLGLHVVEREALLEVGSSLLWCA